MEHRVGATVTPSLCSICSTNAVAPFKVQVVPSLNMFIPKITGASEFMTFSTITTPFFWSSWPHSEMSNCTILIIGIGKLFTAVRLTQDALPSCRRPEKTDLSIEVTCYPVSTRHISSVELGRHSPTLHLARGIGLKFSPQFASQLQAFSVESPLVTNYGSAQVILGILS